MKEKWIPGKNRGLLGGEQKRGKLGCPDTSLETVLTSCMKLGKPASHFELYFPYLNNGTTHILDIHFLFP